MRGRSTLIEELDGLLGYGFQVDDVMRAVGTSYDAGVKVLKRAQRADLVEQLKVWRDRQVEQQMHASGRHWT